MMQRRTALVTVSAIGIALVASACGGGGSGDAPKATSGAAVAASPVDPAAYRVGEVTCAAVGDVVSISAPVTNTGNTPIQVRLASSVALAGSPSTRFGHDVAIGLDAGQTAPIHAAIGLASGQKFAEPLECSLDEVPEGVSARAPVSAEALSNQLRSGVNASACDGDDGQCAMDVSCEDPASGTATCSVSLVGPGATPGGAQKLEFEIVVNDDGTWTKTLTASS